MAKAAAAAAAAAGCCGQQLPLEAEQRYQRKVEHAHEQLHKMANFTSDDYDVAETDLHRQLILNTTPSQYKVEQAWAWFMSFLVGLTNGIIGFLFNWAIQVLTNVRYRSMLQYITPGGGFIIPYLINMAFVVLYSAIAGFLGSYLSPLAAGSGISEIKVYLNGVHVKGLLTIKTFVAKSLGVAFAISSGLYAGKEGPFIHVGAIIGGGVSGMGSQSITRWTKGKFRAKLRRTFGGFFRDSITHRDYVASGASAGITTAFSAPIGGILFAIEEGASFFNLTMLWHAFLAAGTALYTIMLLTEARTATIGLWKYQFGASQNLTLDSAVPSYLRFWYYFWELPIFCAMGVFGGLAGALLVFANNFIMAYRLKYIPRSNPLRRMLEVILIAVITATLWFTVSYAGACGESPVAGYPPPPAATHDTIYISNHDDELYPFFPQLWCPPGQYSQYGALFFLPIDQALIAMFQYQELENGTNFYFHVAALITFFFLGYTMMCFTYGIGAATGLFIPALVTGGAMGRLVGRFMMVLINAAGTEAQVQISIQSYAVVGAAALLGGTTRMLLSITVLIMETTGAQALTVPLILTTFFAKVTADAICEGVYDTQIARVGYPFLEARPRRLSHLHLHHHTTVGDLMTTDLFTLPRVLRVRDLICALRSYPYSVFPLTDCPPEPPVPPVPPTPSATSGARDSEMLQQQPLLEDPSSNIVGVISRVVLLKMLQYRYGFVNTESILHSSQLTPTTKARVSSALPQLHQYPLKAPDTPRGQELLFFGLSDDELEQCIDLQHYMTRHPYVLPAETSLSRAYHLFRSIGLHQVFVTRGTIQIVGLLTRRQFTHEFALIKGSERRLAAAQAVAAADADRATAAAAVCQPSEPTNGAGPDPSDAGGTGHPREKSLVLRPHLYDWVNGVGGSGRNNNANNSYNNNINVNGSNRFSAADGSAASGERSGWLGSSGRFGSRRHSAGDGSTASGERDSGFVGTGGSTAGQNGMAGGTTGEAAGGAGDGTAGEGTGALSAGRMTAVDDDQTRVRFAVDGQVTSVAGDIEQDPLSSQQGVTVPPRRHAPMVHIVLDGDSPRLDPSASGGSSYQEGLWTSRQPSLSPPPHQPPPQLSPQHLLASRLLSRLHSQSRPAAGTPGGKLQHSYSGGLQDTSPGGVSPTASAGGLRMRRQQRHSLTQQQQQQWRHGSAPVSPRPAFSSSRQCSSTVEEMINETFHPNSKHIPPPSQQPGGTVGGTVGANHGSTVGGAGGQGSTAGDTSGSTGGAAERHFIVSMLPSPGRRSG